METRRSAFAAVGLDARKLALAEQILGEIGPRPQPTNLTIQAHSRLNLAGGRRLTGALIAGPYFLSSSRFAGSLASAGER